MIVGTLGYPGEYRRFAHYSERFRSVEIASTYHKVPSWRTISRWRARAPEGFTYSLLSPRFLGFTVNGEERRSLRRFLRRVRALGRHRGAVRFLLPEGLAELAFRAWLELLASLNLPVACAFDTYSLELAEAALSAGHAVVNRPESPFLYLLDPNPPLPQGSGYAYFSSLSRATSAG